MTADEWYFPHGTYTPPFEPEKNKGFCPPYSCFGDPINAGTGNRYETATEFVGTGPFPLEFRWTYNSTGGPASDTAADQVLGWGRSHTYSRRVRTYTDAAGLLRAEVTRPDGNIATQTWKGTYWKQDNTQEGQLTATLVGGVQTGWTYTSFGGETEIYDPQGRLRKLVDGQGFTQNIAYDANGRMASVTDHFGRAMVFAYNANSRIQTLTQPDGNVVTFAYDGNDNLSTVTHPGNATTTYLYGEATYTAGVAQPHALTGVTDANLVRFSTTTYDALGHANGTWMGAGVDRFNATYTLSAGGDYLATATIATPDGKTVALTMSTINENGGRVVAKQAVVSCTGCPTQTEKYSYEYSGRPESQTDAAGVVTAYQYDSEGRTTQITRAKGTPQEQVEYWSWGNRDVPDTHGRPGQQHTYAYNSRNQLLTDTVTDTAASVSRVIETRTYCEQDGVSAGTCPAVGLLLTIDGARTDVSDVTTYSYYMSDAPNCAGSPTTCAWRTGDLRTVTNALGKVVENLAYDGAGRLLSQRDANGVVTDFEYSSRGWQAARKVRGPDSTTEADDAIFRTDYDPVGQLQKVTLPDGSSTTNEYDAAHRLTGIHDGLGNRITYLLDDAGHRISEETRDPSGALKRSVARIYDALGRLKTSADGYSTPIDYSYDAAGRLDQRTDVLGRVTDFDYDPIGRVSQVIGNAAGAAGVNRPITVMRYDGRNNVTSIVDPKNLTTSYVYDGFDQLKTLTSPDTGATSFTYDSAGHRATRTDALGKVTTYGYDALGRATSQTVATAAQNVYLDYDAVQAGCTAAETFGVGHVTRVRDESGNTRYCYDRRGNLVRQIQTVTGGSTLTVGGSFDLSNRVIAMTYPSGAIVVYLRDGSGRVRRVDAVPSPGAAQEGLVTSVGYLPYGPAQSITFGNGRVLTRSYDQNYAIDKVSDSATTNPLSEDYTLDAVGRITGLAERTSATTVVNHTFGYDAVDRLTSHKNGSTVVEGFAYDATGNRTSKTVGTTNTAYTYATTSHRLSSVGSTPRTYNANGATIANGKGGSIKEYVFDDRSRLRDFKLGGKVKASYRYNGLGQRVLKTDAVTAANSRQYVYDVNGNLLGEYTLAGVRIKEYVWLDGSIVAILSDHDGSTYQYVESDHLGTPRAVVHPTKNVIVWRWDANNTAFGEHLPAENPDANALNYNLNLRFPGQYYDAESAVHYNAVRDYDPTAGRYLESDPLGLQAGPSTYGYAMQTPLDLVDPSGLTTWTGIMSSLGGGEILGGGEYEFHLSSKCQKGRKVDADVFAIAGGLTDSVPFKIRTGSVGGSGGGISVGSAEVGIEWVELSDDWRGEPDANSLAGWFGYLSASLVFGGGLQASTVYLGSTATGGGSGEAELGPAIGLDIGVKGFLGISTVISSRPSDCKSCDKE